MSEPDANGWMDINTVPKDGTRVLFFDPRRGQREGNAPDGYGPGMWTFMRVSPRKAWWRGFAFTDGYTPTHWRPLHKPPVSTPPRPEGE